jgi:hypothetical protein
VDPKSWRVTMPRRLQMVMESNGEAVKFKKRSQSSSWRSRPNILGTFFELNRFYMRIIIPVQILLFECLLYK